MKIRVLEKTIFNEFSKSHCYHTFYQTSMYGDLMEKHGFDVEYLGFFNHSDVLIGATLVLYQKVFYHYKYAYAPRGFLMDYGNYDLLQEVTEQLRKYLYRKHFVFFRIDPPIQCSLRDVSGNILFYNPEVNTLLHLFQDCHYQHKGFNLFFENNLPRWDAVINLHKTSEELFQGFKKQVRNKIHKANKSGMVVYQATPAELPIFYEFIKHKHKRTLEYYRHFFECFGNDIELYLVKLDAHKYVRETKAAYEKALVTSDQLTSRLQDKNTKGKDIRKFINRKMEADKVLSREQGNLVRSTRLYQEKPEGIIVGGAIIIKQNKTVSLLIEGFDREFRSFNPNYYLKWDLIQRFNQAGYQQFNLNAIIGNFKEKTKYTGLNEMKLGFSSYAVEYIGEFDYVINPILYRLYLKRKGNLKGNEISKK